MVPARGTSVGGSRQVGSEICQRRLVDDTHLVVDLERGIQKVRTVRRMPEEFRWNAEMLQDIRFAPWKPTPGKSAQVVGRNMCITERMTEAHGTTDSCRKCFTEQENHSAECRQRFEKIQDDLLQEKLRQASVLPEDRDDQTVVTPALAASSSSPSDERIRKKRAGLHGPEREPVQTSSGCCDGRCG